MLIEKERVRRHHRRRASVQGEASNHGGGTSVWLLCSWWDIGMFCKCAWNQVNICLRVLACACECVCTCTCSVVCILVRVQRPAVLGSLSSSLISCILNQDHTSHLSDDKRSFGHFCQQAQLQSWENKDFFKSPFWLCSSSAAFPSLRHLSLVFCLISLSDVPCLPFSQLMSKTLVFLFFSLSPTLSISLFFPSEEINTISPPREKTNTDNPGRAAGVWPRISQPF